MAAEREIKFYFDYISHNAYLAWTQVGALAARHGCTVRAMPVLFAGLLDHFGTKGPAEVPPKLAWMLKNVLRKAAARKIPIAPPATHPFNPLLVLRVSSLDMDEAVRNELVSALFNAVWAMSRDVTNPETVRAIVKEIGGLGGRDVVAEAALPAAKSKLREQTEAAIANGVFGVPGMLVDHELFWGFDDLPYLDRYLAGSDPLPTGYQSAWSAVKPSANRLA